MSKRRERPERDERPTVAARLRADRDLSWAQAKKLVSTGKVFVDGERVTKPGHRIEPHNVIELLLHAPKPAGPGPRVDIVFQDRHVVVIRKPSGVSSVPYQPGDRDTAIDLLRAAWRKRQEDASGPILVVHRIDKGTSGLLMFARTKRSERHLSMQLRKHSVEREYHCLVHGHPEAQTYRSYFMRDRGDGLRGSNRHDRQGKLSVTHVEPLERLGAASLMRVRLETGRTHQIRIHLSEAGHPLVGDEVYSRDAKNRGDRLIAAPRLMLHAKTLGFSHPISEELVRLDDELPDEFKALCRRLRLGKSDESPR